MTAQKETPDASLSRLALYHCYLGELMRQGSPARITSRQLADELGLKEETVRRDISFVGDVGTPGAGYVPAGLFAALQEHLGLEDEHPVVMVGTAEMLRALSAVFPAKRFGLAPVAFLSELAGDSGTVIDGIRVGHLPDVAGGGLPPGVRVGLVACAPEHAQLAVDVLAGAGVSGILLLTAILGLRRPDGVAITQLRMSCDIKALAFKTQDARRGRAALG